MLEFLHTRQWILARRLVLIGIVLILAYRAYGGSVLSLLRGPNPAHDITITRAEFRTDVPGEKPVWIIGFTNTSRRYAYDEIQMDAAYFDAKGAQVDKDHWVVHQKLAPGQEITIGSSDIKARGTAVRGILKVVGARQVK